MAFEGTPWLKAQQEKNLLVIVNGILIDGTTASGNVVIPNSVTSIGDLAFYGCTSLTSITIPNSVTSIGDYAFYKCTSLTDVYYTGSETEWNNIDIGYYNDNLTNATIHYNYVTAETNRDFRYSILDDGTVEITAYTGSDSKLAIPGTIDGKKVTSIGGYAFEYCESLTSITIPNSVTSIGNYAFYECTSLTSITIPNSVTSIGESAFSSCTSLTNITIPNSVTSIGYYAFEHCVSLTSITIPNSVTSIEYGAFSRCTSLTSITIPNSVTSIGEYAFYKCTSLTNITIPNSVTSIGIGTFYGCTSLTSITIPNSVTSIGSAAFDYCTSLTSITILDSVTSIGESAFKDCTSLTDVYYTGSETEWNKININSYNNCLTDATIHYNYDPTHTHSYTSKTTKAASCTTDGIKTYTCTICGATKTEAIKATGHTFGSWTTTKRATCTAAGTQTRKCSLCGKTETKSIAKLSHTYKTTVVAPTYAAQGYTLHKCSVCGTSYKDKYTAKKTVPTVTAKSTYTCTTNAVRINWNKVSGATGYKIYRYNPTTKQWTALKAIYDPNVLTYKDSNLKAGTVYKYKVKAFVKSNGKFYFGNSCSTITTATKPTTATITKTAKSSTAVRLYWKKVTCTGYKIQRYNSTTKKWVDVKTLSSATTNYRIASLKKNTSYKFRVCAYKNDGKKNLFGAWSYVTVKTSK